jgi:hypothetical protein
VGVSCVNEFISCSPTTSCLAPLLALLALRLRLYFFRSLQTKNPPVPTKVTSAAVIARFLDTQSWRRCMYVLWRICGAGGGGRGRARSGSHPSGRLFFMYPATWAKCASVASHIDPVKLRMSFEYSASFPYVSEGRVKGRWHTHHIQKLLVVTRHNVTERQRYRLK